MRIEQLNTRLVLQRDHSQPGASGRTPGQAWQDPVDVAALWANVDNRTANEVQDGLILAASGRYIVTARWRSDFSDDMRFRWQQGTAQPRFLYITHVPIGARSEFIQLTCEERQ